MRRQHGSNGWTKTECPYSKTGWAWQFTGRCTCKPCFPLHLDVIQALIDNKWEFSIGWTGDKFSICTWKPEWITNNLYAARICPEGKGQTLEDAYRDLQTKIIFQQEENE